MSRQIISSTLLNTQNKTRGVLRVGTSGIALPGGKQTFPESFRHKSRLTYYASLFNTIEINSTFYKIPQQKTTHRWADEVPGNFQFTVKLWREITHADELKFKPADIDLFLEKVSIPPSQQGCLLIQFPGKITFDYLEKFTALLERIDKKNTSRWKLCVEFRNATWYNVETYSLLNHFHAAVVLHDMPPSKYMSVDTKADFVYIRFHGIDGKYRGDYGHAYLNTIAQQVDQWLLNGKDVYAYFNNTMGGAFLNAQYLSGTFNTSGIVDY